MTKVAPAILTSTVEEYTAAIESAKTFAERVHIDLSDGEFAPTLTVGVAQLNWPKEWDVDIHAMVMRPSEYLESLIELRPRTIIFHAETSEDIVPIMQQIKQVGISAGVALLRQTVPSSVEPIIKQADHVMIFSGELGSHGGTAHLMQLEKVRLIRKINPEAEIGWDGGADMSNAFTIGHGGVDVMNVGGALASSANPAETYAKLVEEANRKSVI